MPGHRIEARIPAVERKPTPQLRAVNNSGMAAVRTLGTEVEVRDAQLVELVYSGDHDFRGDTAETGGDQIKVDENFAAVTPSAKWLVRG